MHRFWFLYTSHRVHRHAVTKKKHALYFSVVLCCSVPTHRRHYVIVWALFFFVPRFRPSRRLVCGGKKAAAGAPLLLKSRPITQHFPPRPPCAALRGSPHLSKYQQICTIVHLSFKAAAWVAKDNKTRRRDAANQRHTAATRRTERQKDKESSCHAADFFFISNASQLHDHVARKKTKNISKLLMTTT